MRVSERDFVEVTVRKRNEGAFRTGGRKKVDTEREGVHMGLLVLVCVCLREKDRDG